MTQEVGRPRPVVNTAHKETVAARVVAGSAAILGGLPALLIGFGLVDWGATEVAAYSTFLGLVTGGVLTMLGQQTKKNALEVEAQVTPVHDPMGDAGTPLVPIADDGYEA